VNSEEGTSGNVSFAFLSHRYIGLEAKIFGSANSIVTAKNVLQRKSENKMCNNSIGVQVSFLVCRPDLLHI
jgi:hypothetical protein